MAFISISDLWNTWNIRGFVILSLLFQVFLILFASLRKKIANDRIISLLWLAYLMADWVAAFAVGLISHNQGNSSTRGVKVNEAVQAFWASFLLLHLGGPDTITAFSLEDSLLWQRHLLSLIFQVGAIINAFVHIFPSDKSLVIPTILVFLVGVIKNAERILALHLSSFPRLRESVNPQHPKAEWHFLYGALDRYEYSHEEEVKLDESIVVKHAYDFFQIFKVFLVDLVFNSLEEHASHRYFHKISPLDALRVISVELQFMYEVLHTKALVIHSKWSYIFRFIALNFLIVAFVLFNHLKKHMLPEADIKITYSLLFGGIALDVIALFMLVFSDWTIAKIERHNTSSPKLNSFLQKLISATDYLREARFAACETEPNANNIYEILDTPFIFRRWSESISACNLFSEIWKESPRKMNKCNRGWSIISFFNLCSFQFHMDGKIISCFHQAREKIAKVCCPRKSSMTLHIKYMSKNPFIKKLWIHIFKEVRRTSENDPTMSAREVFEARGNLFLESSPEGKDCRDLLYWVTGINYDSSILTWHIATEFWYNREKPIERNEEREFSKIISDYMLYLIVNQPNVMFAVAGNAQISSMEILERLYARTGGTKDVKGEWMRIFEDSFGFRYTMRHGPSLLSGGFTLAVQMERLGEMKWKVMCGVWVEILTYAATHIRGEAHAQVLSKGGELLAFVWLLMAHFGRLYKPPWGTVYGTASL